MKTTIMIAIILVLWSSPLYSAADVQPPLVPAQEQPEVLTRGPVHEAFAEPVSLQIQAGLVVPSQPPANITENSPSQRPVGDQFVLVPGYWSWDADRSDYIWISACWRAAPPNMYWVPGYWARVNEGWEWVAGFWAPQSGTQEIEYLPAPPALEDVQPSGPSPSQDNIWVPPCQYWYQGHYVRRPGYWLTAQPDWVWVPSRYVWTPRGYIFVAGSWDYTLERRGMLFAPVYFPRAIYGRAEFSYSPSIVIDIGALQLSLFAYPRYCHYYFGDYYDDAYLRVGIYPWFESERNYTWYDPIYQHDRWHYRQTEPRWEETERHEYDLRRADRNLRPARTYNEMEVQLAKLPEPQRKNVRMARPLTAFVADTTIQMKFEQSSTESQRNIATQATAVRKFADERNRWETPAAGPKTGQPTVEHKVSVTPPTTERREPTTATPERKAPVTPPAEHKEQVTQPMETKAPFVPPREVRIAQPERVKVPAPPIVGKERAAEKGPPSRPVNESKYKDEVKDTAKENQRTGDTKDKDKNKDK